MNPIETVPMAPRGAQPPSGRHRPTQFDLPCEDGAVENAHDLPQSALLKETLLPVLNRLHPDGNFCVTHDTGIFYEYIPERNVSRVIVPDWCYVPNVPFLVRGMARRSFVTWEEEIKPVVALEYVSGNGREERDRTPETGKFWIYEQKVRPEYYGIYEGVPERLDVHRLVSGSYVQLTANASGRYLIEPLGVELGIWRGNYQGVTLPWLRWFESGGHLLPTEWERAESERARNDRLAAKLRELGIDPDQV
jgi:Putative restriction endonuclease